MGSAWPPRGPDDLDDGRRARIRREVLGSVRPLRRTFAQRIEDRAYDAAAALGRPAPYLVRVLVTAAVIVSIVGGATLASADSLPAEPLYSLKLAGERVRLALAGSPADRASVELSMADHRLGEAVRLVRAGRDAEAVEVTSAYGAHLANAAAELATVERLSEAARPVVAQLKQRLAEQQHQASDMAARFARDPVTAPGAEMLRTIASIAPPLPSGGTVSVGIAEHAASVAAQIAAVAERIAEDADEERIAAQKQAAPPDEEGNEGQEGTHDQEPMPGAASASPAPARPTRPPVGPLARPSAAAERGAAPTRAAAAIGETGPSAARPVASARAKPTATPKVTPRATIRPERLKEAKAAAERAKHLAEKAREAAEKAHEAAERAREAAKKTAKPKPRTDD